MLVRLRHSQTGLLKECPMGFSWTTLAFGWFVPFYRGWFLYFFIYLITTILTLGLASVLILPWVINRQYIKYLLEMSFVPASAIDLDLLQGMGIMFSNERGRTPTLLGA